MTRDDPQQVLLSEVIAKINTLFGGEFADPQIGGFVIAAAGMAEEDPRIAEQIDNNAVDQFLVSPDLRETLTDAAVLNEGAFGKLTGALTGENERADELHPADRRIPLPDPARPHGDRGYRITGLTEVFGIYETVDQAIAVTKGRR